MTKKNTKLGEQIVDDPNAQIVTDGDSIPPEVAAALNDQSAAASVEEALKDTVPASSADDATDTILVENKGRVRVGPGQKRAFRCFDLNAVAYEHVSEDPATGEWVYKQS